MKMLGLLMKLFGFLGRSRSYHDNNVIGITLERINQSLRRHTYLIYRSPRAVDNMENTLGGKISW